MSCLNFEMLRAFSSPEKKIEAGGDLQALGYGMNAITSLAGGLSRSYAAKAEAAAERAGTQARVNAIRRAADMERGSARTAAAASGVAVDSGSVLEAERDITRYSEQDALMSIVSGESRARALRSAGKGALIEGAVGMGENLLIANDIRRRTRRTRHSDVYPPVDWT